MPGGALNADQLRAIPKAVAFAKSFFDADKPVAAICHAFWTLIESGAVKGRTMTSWPSIQTDIKNAGGTWVDKEVNVDGRFISSRKPDDIPAFNEQILAIFAEAKRTPALSRN
jgi:protease I